MERIKSNTKRIVILSSKFNKLFSSEMPDSDVLIFNSFVELCTHIEEHYIQADVMYVTEEILGRTPMNYIQSLVNKLTGTSSLSVNSTEILVSVDSTVPELVQAIKDDAQYAEFDLKISAVAMPQVYLHLASYIKGELRDEDTTLHGKHVFVQRKSIYAESKARELALQKKYKTQEQELSEVSPEECPEIQTMISTAGCEMLTIASLTNTPDRNVFAYLMCQYLAQRGKVLFVEKDFEFHMMADIVSRSNKQVFKVDMEDLNNDATDTLNRIQNCQEQLVFVSASHRNTSYSYDFICNILYYNLKNYFNYMVLLKDYSELSSTAQYIGVLPCDVPSLLRELLSLPEQYTENATLVGVHTSKVIPFAMEDSQGLSAIAQDVLSWKDVQIPILNIQDVDLGGDVYDLRSLLRK